MKAALASLSFIARHPLASRRPLASFYRYGWWQIASRLRDVIEYDWVSGSRLAVTHGMTGATGNIYCGLHEFNDMGFLLHLLRSEDLFIDAGANIGSFTVLASAVCGARAIAVEPDPVAAARLRRNLEINGIQSRVEVVEAALGAGAGSAFFTVGRDTMNHVANEGPSTRRVEVRALDEVLGDRKPQFLKMDVEGYEAAVVAGASKTLAQDSLLAIVTETADSSVRRPIEAAGFRQFFYDPFSRKLSADARGGSSRPANSLFLRNFEEVERRVSAAPKREIVGVVL